MKLEEARKILMELADKSEFVSWNNEERTEYFGLITKGLEGKVELMEEGYLCYDLGDIEN